MKYNVTNHLRTLLRVSFLLIGVVLFFTSSITAQIPKPKTFTYDDVAKVAKVSATSGIIRYTQYNLTAAASPLDENGNPKQQQIDNIVYYYVPGQDTYGEYNVLTGDGFPPASINDDGDITYTLGAWEGFWIRTLRNCNIVFQSDDGPGLLGNLQLPLVKDQWKIISIPFAPNSKDPSVVSNTEFLKWINLLLAPDYGDFLSSMSLVPADLDSLAFAPGRAYWVKTTDAIAPSILGSPTTFTKPERHQYQLRLNSAAGDGVGDYMVGNPFQSAIPFMNVLIEVPLRNNLGSGKIASSGSSLYNDLVAIKSWAIDLKLTDSVNSHIDASNKAGVIESGKDLHSLFNAQDFVAPLPGGIIRLAFVNPEDSNSRLAWDYRGPGQDSYNWTVELSTTISSIATKLSLSNFATIPSDYTVTLTDKATGKVYALNGDASFDVALTSVAPKTFILTATRQKPVSVAEAGPVALALQNIYPNPFNPSTTIAFDVKKAGVVNLAVYNISGQLVDTLINSPMTAGAHQVVWNAGQHSSGVYIVRLTSNGFTDTKKVTFMK